MEQIRLSPRLRTILSMIPPGSSVADVGTDHGYLPVFLAQVGTYGPLAACDINPGPLDRARRTAAAFGVSERIRFVLCPGLDFPGSPEYETIVIAGMGGELIASILEAAPWTRPGHRLILQPNSKIDVLNAWLTDHGYRVTDAKLVKDAGKLYQVLSAAGGISESLSPAQRWVHPLYLTQRDPLLPEYLDGLIGKYRAALKGMCRGRSERPKAEALDTLLRELNAMRKETEAWQR